MPKPPTSRSLAAPGPRPRARGIALLARIPPALLLAAAAAGACAARPGTSPPPAAAAGAAGGATWTYEPDLEVSHPPFERMHVDWKHRLDQPYVYVEHLGSYVETGHLLPLVQSALEAQGLDAAGPPFALFYDDPGLIPVERLRSRACIPVRRPVEVDAPLASDILPSTTVVYAVVGGAYPDVPRSYPGLFAYMRRLRWVEDGPIREIYLVRPGAVGGWSELRCEVQVPVTHADG